MSWTLAFLTLETLPADLMTSISVFAPLFTERVCQAVAGCCWAQ